MPPDFIVYWHTREDNERTLIATARAMLPDQLAWHGYSRDWAASAKVKAVRPWGPYTRRVIFTWEEADGATQRHDL
jgi:hypothetical protein